MPPGAESFHFISAGPTPLTMMQLPLVKSRAPARVCVSYMSRVYLSGSTPQLLWKPARSAAAVVRSPFFVVSLHCGGLVFFTDLLPLVILQGVGSRRGEAPFMYRSVVTLGAAAGMLAACGGSTTSSALPQANPAPDVFIYHHSFYYTGKKQLFRVPSQVRSIRIIARGAAGGGGGSFPARGGRVYAMIPVTPGETLTIYVGGDGASGGFNGGGAGGAANPSCKVCYPGYDGGGASDVRQSGDGLRNRILVAAGGGGYGGVAYGYYNLVGTGGPGGGLVGRSGGGGGSYGGGGGEGGTQTSGGAGGKGGSGYGYGSPGSSGRLGAGGAGGSGTASSSGYGGTAGGGGGAGGYYGGGGGGSGTSSADGSGSPSDGGGGGGGSSYVERRASEVHIWSDWHNATTNGLVVFGWNKST